MTDRVQKIHEEVERLREQLQNKVEESDFISGEVFIINYFLTFIDSLQEESVPLTKENSTPLSGGERADSSKQGNSAKKNFRERYKRIAESTEFMSSHNGMSIGEVIPVESKEPVSIWHDASEKPKPMPVVLFGKFGDAMVLNCRVNVSNILNKHL